MMDSTAIKEIQKAEVTANLNTSLDKMLDMNQVIALPDGYKVISLEEHQAARNYFRGVMSTTDFDSFRKFVLDGLSKIGIDHALLVVDADEKNAICLLDYVTEEGPGHCKFRARYSLKATADFCELKKMSDRKFSMNDFANFIQDNRTCLNLYDANDGKISISAAISAVRNVRVDKIITNNHESGPLLEAKSSSEKLDAQAKNNNVPDTFDFVCMPYMGLASRGFQCRVSLNLLDVSGGKCEPKFSFKIVNLDKIDELIGLELQNKVTTGFPDSGEKMSILIGNFNPN